jgi:four helix bundle protein
MLIFENLEVYKKAFAQNQKIYRLLKKDISIPRYMQDQLGRASLSIQLNIAEGSGRFAKKDRRNFFVVGRSSALECASLIEFLRAENEIPEEIYLELINGYEEISKMLFAMIKNLENL